MRRFLVENLQASEGSCVITGQEARHIIRVLRMGPGDRLILMDGKGRSFQASIESATRREVRVALDEPLEGLPPSPVEMTLCQALLKSGPMDYVIQKASELGVDRIHPFSSLRTIPAQEGKRLAARLRHWRGIAVSSAKQSGRPVPLQLDPPIPFHDLTASLKEAEGLKAILWEGEEAMDMKGLLRDFPLKDRFIGMVGPEGGFAEEEVSAAEDAGFVAVSLGKRILRSETAAMTIAAVVQYEWGDLGISRTS